MPGYQRKNETNSVPKCEYAHFLHFGTDAGLTDNNQYGVIHLFKKVYPVGCLPRRTAFTPGSDNNVDRLALHISASRGTHTTLKKRSFESQLFISCCRFESISFCTS